MGKLKVIIYVPEDEAAARNKRIAKDCYAFLKTHPLQPDTFRDKGNSDHFVNTWRKLCEARKKAKEAFNGSWTRDGKDCKVIHIKINEDVNEDVNEDPSPASANEDVDEHVDKDPT